MGKKILFAVMALLVMATGKIGAQTPYALLCQNGTDDQGVTTYSMHFVYTTANVNTGGNGEITVGGGSNKKKLTYTKAWEINPANTGDPTWYRATEKGSITQAVFEESFKDFEVTNCTKWFDGLNKLAEIKDIKNLNTSAVKYMVWMFYGCSSLKSLDLSSFNTSEAVNTASMFRDCSSLGQITFGNNFKTSNTESMFQGCKALTTLNGLSNFDTSEVAYMSYMFNGCEKLTSLDLRSFNTSQVTNMMYMFNGCSSLTELDLRSFNTSAVTDMESMFNGCSSLTTLNLSSFNTSSVTNMRDMFNDCKNLSNLTLGCFDMTLEKEVNKKNNMFYNCNNITIDGNALVFVTSDAQKNIWEGITRVKLMVKNDGEDKYVSDGTVDITLDNDKDTPVIFPHDFTANSVTFKRTFAAGKPHTICLPFAITNTADYGTFYKLSSYDKDNRRVKFTKIEGATEANTPYLFILDKNKTDVTKIEVKGDVDISSTADETYTSNAGNDSYTRFCGVYRKKTFTEQDLGGWFDIYGWTEDGSFKRATAGASVAPCRAYIRLKKGGAGIGSAPARLSVEFDDGETTGIDTIGTAKSGADGGADAPMYNLQGQRVGSGYKGVVIKNGKKMIVR